MTEKPWRPIDDWFREKELTWNQREVEPWERTTGEEANAGKAEWGQRGSSRAPKDPRKGE